MYAAVNLYVIGSFFLLELHIFNVFGLKFTSYSLIKV